MYLAGDLATVPSRPIYLLDILGCFYFSLAVNLIGRPNLTDSFFYLVQQ